MMDQSVEKRLIAIDVLEELTDYRALKRIKPESYLEELYLKEAIKKVKSRMIICTEKDVNG